jgi:hypothetical protein
MWLGVRFLATVVSLFLAAVVTAKGAPRMPLCSASQLAAADAGTKTFGSRRVTRIIIVNNSTGKCSLNGYPQIRFASFSAIASPVTLKETAVDAAYKTPGPTTIVLGSLRRATFLLGYRRPDLTNARGDPCASISNIDIVVGPPAHSGTVSLPDTIAPCGAVDVSPFFRSK